jgi:hypothetical protein
VHQVLGPDNCIDGAGIAAVQATDTPGFVNDRHRLSVGRRLGKRQDVAAEEFGKPPDRVITTGRAEIDCNAVIDDSGGIRSAARETALRALRLRQLLIDLLHEFVGIWWQPAGGVAQRQPGNQRDQCYGEYSCPHTGSRPLTAEPCPRNP